MDDIKKQVKNLDAPLREIDPILNNFAAHYGKKVITSYYHDAPVRNIFFSVILEKECRIWKSIYLYADNCKRPANYKVSVLIAASQGVIKDIVAMIFPRKKRMHFRKIIEITSFEDKIDPERLRDELDKAKKTLDEFDNSSIILTTI